MPLEFRKNADGKLRPFWYGCFEVNGRRRCVNLGVKIAGTPPKGLSLKNEGDGAFERSRATARTKLEAVIGEARSKRDSVHLVERIYEMKTGEKIRVVTLNDLPEEWTRIPWKREPNARYAEQCRSILRRFTSFIQGHWPTVEDLSGVSREHVRRFLASEKERGVSAKTWNDTLKLLRGTFKHLHAESDAYRNYLTGIPTRETETIFRKPFTPEELKAIVDSARNDDFIRPILITGICTAMRRGDCCLLKWADVDLRRQFITVKTAKTGVTVSIPVFPMLYDELVRCPNKDTEYVFPEQARMYRENPDGITWRVRKVFALAGFKDIEEEIDGEGAKKAMKSEEKSTLIAGMGCAVQASVISTVSASHGSRWRSLPACRWNSCRRSRGTRQLTLC